LDQYLDTKAKKKRELNETSLALSIDRDQGVIALPKNLENVAADFLIQKVLQLSVRHKLALAPSPGRYRVHSDSPDNEFWNGYFEELLSNKRVETITYNKTSLFANGRASARFECLKAVTPSDNISWLRNIHKEISGSDKVTPLLYRYVVKLFEEKDRNDAMYFFKSLCFLVTSRKGYGIEKFNLNKFFPTFEDHISSVKRRREVKQGKGKNSKTKSVPVSATKPSQLRTVLPYEKSAVSEFWETPWREIEALRVTYTGQSPEQVNRSELVKKLKLAINSEWKAKSAVLKQTKHRMVPVGPNSTLRENLANTQRELAKFKTEESYLEYITQKERSIPVFPIGEYTDGKDVHTSFVSFLRTEIGRDKFPICCSLLSTYEKTGIVRRIEQMRLTTELREGAAIPMATLNRFNALASD